MTFEEYLITKKIDLKSFQETEPDLYESWRMDFEQVHPNSFTAQKLYLINPIRRKYTLRQEIIRAKIETSIVAVVNEEVNNDANGIDQINQQKQNSPEIPDQIPSQIPESKPVPPGSKPARPVFKPKPKIT